MSKKINLLKAIRRKINKWNIKNRKIKINSRDVINYFFMLLTCSVHTEYAIWATSSSDSSFASFKGDLEADRGTLDPALNSDSWLEPGPDPEPKPESNWSFGLELEFGRSSEFVFLWMFS